MPTDWNLVLGTDFSEGATAALLEARRVQPWTHARLIVVHVSASHPDAWRNDPASENWLRNAGLAESDLVVRSGQPSVELARFADRVHALALIVGSHGRSGFQPVRLGSTAERVTAMAGCPVLIVNPRGAGRPLRPGVPSGDKS